LREWFRLAGHGINQPTTIGCTFFFRTQFQNNPPSPRGSDSIKHRAAPCRHNWRKLLPEINELDLTASGVVFKQNCGRVFAAFGDDPEDSFAILGEAVEANGEGSVVFRV
jgi:hypothetical protein